MNEYFQALLETIGALGGAAILIYGLANLLGKFWVDKMMVAEKAKYDKILAASVAEHNTKLDALRSDLARTAFRFETRFSRLHEKRAEVIADLFTKIVAVYHAANSHLRGVVYGEQQQKEFSKCLGEASDVFQKNEIYFDPSLCDSIEDFINTLFSFDVEKMIDASSRGTGPLDPEIKERMLRRSAYLESQMPAIRQRLTDEFRTLLGVGSD